MLSLHLSEDTLMDCGWRSRLSLGDKLALCCVNKLKRRAPSASSALIFMIWPSAACVLMCVCDDSVSLDGVKVWKCRRACT